jgi:antitoxin FitA
MSVAITIREVPEEVRDELAARADQEGKSMQQYLRQLLIATANRPSQKQLIREITERNKRRKSHLSRDFIVDAIREGRER